MKMEDINSETTATMSVSIPSPRRRLICREDLPSPNGGETDIFSKDLSRKRQFNLDNFGGVVGGGGGVGGVNLGSCTPEFGPPLTKRIKF